jgi:hypothetical protein
VDATSTHGICAFSLPNAKKNGLFSLSSSFLEVELHDGETE